MNVNFNFYNQTSDFFYICYMHQVTMFYYFREVIEKILSTPFVKFSAGPSYNPGYAPEVNKCVYVMTLINVLIE